MSLKEKDKFDYIEPDTAVIIEQLSIRIIYFEISNRLQQSATKPISYFTDKPEYKKCSPITDQVIINNIKRGILKSPIVKMLSRN